MSGNSADSFSEDSEAEEEKEEVKEKAEVMVKKKGPGRPPRKKRPPAPPPPPTVSPPISNAHKRRCVPQKSGNSQPMKSWKMYFLVIHFTLITLLPPHRKAWRAEASLVRGRACRCGDSPKEEPHWVASASQGWLWALSGTLPPAGEQPERLEGHQVLRPQPHPAPEEAGQEGERCCCLLGHMLNVGRDSYHNV